MPVDYQIEGGPRQETAVKTKPKPCMTLHAAPAKVNRLSRHSSLLEPKERCIVATLLADWRCQLPASITKLLRCAPESFDDLRLGTIAAAIQALATDGKPVAPLTVGEYLEAVHKLEAAGGNDFLHLLANDAVNIDVAELEAGPVWQAFTERRANTIFADAQSALEAQPAALPSILAGVRQAIDDISDGDGRPELGEWIGHFEKATCTPEALAQLSVPPREPILGEWFRQGDLGFIYGPRGSGKTWLAMHLARQCAEGGQVADWNAHKPRRVLYVDGEMPLDGIRERDIALSDSSAGGMFYLQHEVLFHLTGKVLNLTSSAVQTALLETCQRNGMELIFLDNLSCLFSGIKENDADAWELVLPWLLDLRRNRIAAVFIAHAGRNGLMRGTSRREDAAFWVMQLTEANDAAEVQNGAKFVCRFVKNRNATEQECPPLEWHFCKTKDEPHARVSWKKLSTLQVFRQWVQDGLTGASDIAGEMSLSKGQVSKLAKQGMAAGWLIKDGREYALAGQA